MNKTFTVFLFGLAAVAGLLMAAPAMACHGLDPGDNCGSAGPGYAASCDDQCMPGSWCVDSAPGDGYQTSWGRGKRNNDGWCGGWGACRIQNCYRDFGCNAGFTKVGGGGDDSNGPNGWCRPACAGNQGQSCQSGPNACGMRRSNGSIQCDGSCSSTPPPNNQCPAPACVASPANQLPGQPVTATGSGAFGAYSWNSGGGNPAGGSGNPRVFTYAATGAKTITVTDGATGRSATCGVNICMGTFNQPCQTAGMNGCGMHGNGTYDCNGICNAVVPPNTACPSPACVAAPGNAQTGQVVTLTGSSGIPGYNWNTGGGNPAGGSGSSINTIYSSSGTKVITVTDSNAPPKQGICNVNIGAAVTATGMVTTSQGQPGTIGFSTNYNIQIKVWDVDGRESLWSAPYAYSTKPGPWPKVDFTYVPSKSFAGLPTNFTDKTLNSPISWMWTFGDGNTSVLKNPSNTYAVEGTYNVILAATNADGNTCSATKSIGVTKPIPTYREVRPGQSTPTPPADQRPPTNPNGR